MQWCDVRFVNGLDFWTGFSTRRGVTRFSAVNVEIKISIW
jgi:hypothetical protein